MLVFMKKAILLALLAPVLFSGVLFGGIQSASAAETEAVKSPFLPTGAILAKQTKYTRSAQYKGFVTFANMLNKNAKKGSKYSKSRVRSARSNIIQKIDSNRDFIEESNSGGAYIIAIFAKRRTEYLYNKSLKSFAERKVELGEYYRATLTNLNENRKKALKKTYRIVKKKYNVAYKAQTRKRLRKNLSSAHKTISSRYYQGVKNLRDKTSDASEAAVASYYTRVSNHKKRTSSEIANSLKFLATRSRNQIDNLRTTREKAVTALKKLSESKFSDIKTVEGIPAVSVKQIALATPAQPEAFVLADWPSMATPSKYSIPKGYLSPKVKKYIAKVKAKRIAAKKRAAREKARKAKALKEKVISSCKAGRDYNELGDKRKALGNKRSAIKNQNTALSQDVESVRDAVQRLSKKQKEAQKKFNKEKSIRLTKPDDNDYKQAKNRLREANSELALAKDNLSYLRGEQGDSANRYRGVQSRIDKVIRKQNSLKRKQAQYLNTADARRGAKSICPNYIL